MSNDRFPSRGNAAAPVQTPAAKPAPAAAAVPAVTRESVLADLRDGKIDVATASAFLASLERQSNSRSLTCKVSEKGAVSVYGLQRMPVTLYGEQWARLIDFAPQITSFISANQSALATKQR